MFKQNKITSTQLDVLSRIELRIHRKEKLKLQFLGFLFYFPYFVTSTEYRWIPTRFFHRSRSKSNHYSLKSAHSKQAKVMGGKRGLRGVYLVGEHHHVRLDILGAAIGLLGGQAGPYRLRAQHHHCRQRQHQRQRGRRRRHLRRFGLPLCQNMKPSTP